MSGPEEQPRPHEAAYQAYLSEPSRQSLAAVVDALKPTIGGVLRGIGADNDPLVSAKAKVLAAKAIRSYDPGYGAGLHTWTAQQLQPLRRFKRVKQQPVHVPERAQLDAFHLMQKEHEFIDAHGRDPDVAELADFAKIPVSRITDVRRTFRAMGTEGSGETQISNAQSMPDHVSEALQYVHTSADHIDRRILEHKTGYGGVDILQPQEIARRLRISPANVSRRAARLTLKIQELTQALEDVN
jgi:DNA-directed RNA polymerase specialized sigma subunit